MKRSLAVPVLQIVSMACFAFLSKVSIAQFVAAENSETTVALKRLDPPVYPPIAKIARVTGDVKIEVRVHRNGTVSTARVLSGHPLLNEAALKSAQESAFECRGCTDDLKSYFLTYSFGLREDIDCGGGVKRVRSIRCLYLWKCGSKEETSTRTPRIEESAGHITLLDDSVCAQPVYSASSGR